MNYCKICLQPNTRPGIKFDKNGVCPACSFEMAKNDTNSSRDKELEKIIQFGKENANSGYDCIIGVSGGKDSTRQALFVKEVLGMNPLLVSMGYPPEQITQIGADNLSNLIEKGFDCINITASPKIWKKLMKFGFEKYGNMFKSTELALFSSVPRLAIAYQIPLIWWGENAAMQLGDLNVMGKAGYDGNNLRQMNTLSGGNLDWIINEGIEERQILQYKYPSELEMLRANIQIVFLGYFWDDWSLLNNSVYSMLNGLNVRKFDPQKYGDYLPSSALDDDWSNINQMIKYLKFGFGRTTDFVNEEIRLGRMTRPLGIEILRSVDGKCSKELINSFCGYIEIDEKKFWEVVERFVNFNLFDKVKEGHYVPRFQIGEGL